MGINGPGATESVAATSEQRTHRDVIRAFQRVAEALVDTEELDPLLRLIADEVCNLLGATRCSIHLRDEDAGLFRGRVGNSGQGIDDRVKRLVSGGPADRFTQEIVETKKPVVLIDAMSDPRAATAAFRQWNTRSVLGVPMIVQEQVIGLILVDDEGKRTHFSEAAQDLASAFAGLAATAIAQAQLNAKLRSSLQTVARQNRLLRRARTVETELSALLLDGASLSDSVRLVARATQKPCAIYDTSFERVVVADLHESERRMPQRLIEHHQRSHQVVVEALTALESSDAEIIGPFAALGLHHRYLVAPICEADAPWGYLAIGEHMARLAALDMVVARRAAMNISVDVSLQARIMGDRWHAIESLAIALLRGNQSEEWLERRAGYLGVDLEARRLVCVISRPDGQGSGPAPQTLAEEIRRDTGDRPILGAGLDGNAVLLVELPADADSQEANAWAVELLSNLLTRTETGGNVLVGLSRGYLRPDELPRAYEEALQVLDCARRHVAPGGGLILAAEDLGVGRLFLSSASADEARVFARETLGEIAQSASPKARELLVTLQVFLETSRSASQSARRLSVHENTIRYRIARIEELTGLPVGTDPEALMTAHLALLILRISGEYPELGPVGSPIGRRTGAA